MKALLLALAAALLPASLAIGSDRAHRYDELSRGTVQQARQIELDSPIPPDPDSGEDDIDVRYGTQLIVLLDDGRTVILTYSGPRHFAAGQRVRVHVDEHAAFVL